MLTRKLRLAVSFLLSSIRAFKIRKINCYIYLLIWIVIFSFTLYWFLALSSSTTDNPLVHGPTNYVEKSKSENQIPQIIPYKDSSPISNRKDVVDLDVDLKLNQNEQKLIQNSLSTNIENNDLFMKDITTFYTNPERVCNSPEKIQPGDEGSTHPEYKLDGIIILFRHGDRGPLAHIGHHNISGINCQSKSFDDSSVKGLLKFGEGMSKLPGYLQFIGPFHSIPKTPISHVCQLGQLSQLGSTQLIQLGKLIRTAYQSTLFGDLPLTPSAFDTTSPKIISYATRYRRTLQSLISFLYGLLGPKLIIPNVVLRESQSSTFCFKDCSCKLVERLKKISTKSYQSVLEDKLEMTSLVNKINTVLGITRNKRTGTALLDLLLIYSCHNVSLPCTRSSSLMSNNHPYHASPSLTENSSECITTKDVTNLINLIQKESFSLKPIFTNYHYSLLSAYGLLKEIINLALKMTSSNDHGEDHHGQDYVINYHQRNSPVAIFSGHDLTLQSLLGALGIFQDHPDIRLPPYASRFIFEFYSKTKNVSPENSARKYHFRAIYNGISVTHLISFCQKDMNLRADENNVKMFFCPLENLVRFVYDNYFHNFANATNFKDACQFL